MAKKKRKNKPAKPPFGGGTVEVYVDPTPVSEKCFRGFYRLDIGRKVEVKESVLIHMNDVRYNKHQISSKHAELILLKFLLLHREVFGKGASGRGTNLSVSTDDIKLLSDNKSNDFYLRVHGNFLGSRYSESTVTVNSLPQWLPSLSNSKASNEIYELDLINAPHIKTNKINLLVSQHAFNRFTQRFHSIADRVSDPWSALHRAFTLSDWTELPDKANGSKQYKIVTYSGYHYELKAVLKRVGDIFNVVTVLHIPPTRIAQKAPSTPAKRRRVAKHWGAGSTYTIA